MPTSVVYKYLHTLAIPVVAVQVQQQVGSVRIAGLIMFFLPDKVPPFHVALPDNRPVKEKMMKHLNSKIACYLLARS